MRATLMSRTALPYFALVAACGAALAFGVTYIQREPIQHEASPEANAVTAASQASSPALSSASSDRNESPAVLAGAQAEANARQPNLRFRPLRRIPTDPNPPSTLPALSEAVMRSLPAERRLARLLNCCEMASVLTKRSRTSLASSSWSLRTCLLEITS